MTNDEKWMNLAIEQAIKAEKEGEVPIGAVLVKEIGRASCRERV